MTEALHLQREFSSKDFAALRAFAQRLPPSKQLWLGIRRHMRRRSAVAAKQRWRIVHALMLLLGDSGLRREEAAGARREALRPFRVDHGTDVRALTVIGKRSRESTVPVSTETVEAIRAHWRDRGQHPGPLAPCSRHW